MSVLFLLDELLSGTNAEDRRAGAEAVLRRLVDTGEIGLVTTHDLAPTSAADGLGPAGANDHFDERLDGDRLAFDYTMRPGVVRQRNALALMRAVGINGRARSAQESEEAALKPSRQSSPLFFDLRGPYPEGLTSLSHSTDSGTLDP